MDTYKLNQLNQQITHIDEIITTIYYHLIPAWQRVLYTRALAATMAKKNSKAAKASIHHKLAGELIMSSRITKKWRQKNRVQVVPKNTPERMTKASWKKLRVDVKHSIASFEEKLKNVERARAINQLENLNI